MTMMEERGEVRAGAVREGGRVRVGRLWGMRAGFVVLGLVAWFGTQGLIGSRKYNGQIEDGLLVALAPIHTYLWEHKGAADGLLIASSAVIDALALFLLIGSVVGKTVRPFVGLLIVFGLRQIFQGLCVLPMPEGMIWRYPGFPSLLVTYGVSNDLFFSGHTALAVFGCVELVRWGGKKWLWVGIVVAVFEALTVLCLRAHWTMDVYTGAVTALLVAFFVGRVAGPVDRGLARVAGGK